MLSLRPSSTSKKCTPNLIPARLNHNGPINDTQRYWAPETSEDGTSHVYLRGRHLHGTSLTLPENYTGAVVHVTDKPLSQSQTKPQTRTEDEEEEDEKEEVEVNIIEKVGSFDEVLIWGHGGKVDQSQDLYARGLGEWIGFAECMHGEEEEGTEGKTERTKAT
ncbi:hypothetical protein K505DRAFT_284152 [Melanomma pulvis-pyrius CBS 109.77]|uniref:Uncharacterized protein n=1 Tax=Melanomma pulvis-pyrius CBS 109.77 TaxID=1314802 RepID=A0A6A6X035_9PLEO|nr:hypothetical protein K505DRAFT_284152 [Melanomma pulvis-pyrius CBS 109.77]